MSEVGRDHWSTPADARAYREKYRRRLVRRLAHAREVARLRRLLRAVEARGPLLDCPVGTGRMVPLLLEFGRPVLGVDRSEAMVELARTGLTAEVASGALSLSVGELSALSTPEGHFDTALCHRLLHHVRDRGERIAMLSELARVSRRNVVVSFWDASTCRHRMGRREHRRVALRPEEMVEEAREAGLVEPRGPRRLAGCFSRLALMAFRVGPALNRP